MSPIKVTVLENATIFEAEEQIHRYDLPSSGILAGWAVAAVVDQVKTIADARWPDIEVAVAGNQRAIEVLTRTLLNKGVAAYDAEALEEDKTVEEELPIERPTKGRRRLATPMPSLFHVLLAGVILTVLGISWWGMGAMPEGSVAAERPASTSDMPSASPPSSPEGGTVVTEYDRVRMQLPVGFVLAPREDGLLVATGPDPELRVIVAIDPTFGIDAGKVRTEIAAMVADDPLLTEQPNRNIRPAEPTVEYVEDPGDGSRVAWVAWVATGHQFSVGCHSKTELTVSQRATCRMAVESLQFK
ncbi:type VII secretion-associated protein [Corynebacterium sp. H128]|uniref:type VII secretion-associated protein n=1 Tax=unclassified Corynebacterium TaxID=2624378 RepID=UPI0030A772C8